MARKLPERAPPPRDSVKDALDATQAFGKRTLREHALAFAQVQKLSVAIYAANPDHSDWPLPEPLPAKSAAHLAQLRAEFAARKK